MASPPWPEVVGEVFLFTEAFYDKTKSLSHLDHVERRGYRLWEELGTANKG